MKEAQLVQKAIKGIKVTLDQNVKEVKLVLKVSLVQKETKATKETEVSVGFLEELVRRMINVTEVREGLLGQLVIKALKMKLVLKVNKVQKEIKATNTIKETEVFLALLDLLDLTITLDSDYQIDLTKSNFNDLMMIAITDSKRLVKD